MILGTILLAAGLLAALAGAGAAFLVIGGNRAALSWARVTASFTLVFALFASVLLWGLILTQRYEFAYVYQYTSSDLAPFYRFSAFWAGQQGSFLLWLLLGTVLTVLQIRRSRQFEPYVLLFLLLVQAGLSIFLLVDSPFRLLGQTPPDGFGLNPLLQNPWMVSHPPILFVGYAGLAVPFAYALGGLWRRDYDEWVRIALPWTLAGWFFLGLGIYLGAYWAYETLGWGGYWSWDLVENSSLIPWLTGTALLHGMLIQRYRKRLRHGNFVLAIGTFLLVLYATYLTRSGILSEISTHSFVESGLTPWMVGMLLVMMAVGVGLLVSRWGDMPRGPVFAGSSAEEKPLLEGDVTGTVGRGWRTWFSRDFTFLLMILVLLLLTAPVWVGTLVPVVSKLWGPASALEMSFYPLTTAPSALVLVLVLTFCPLLGWRSSTWERLRRLLVVPALFAVAATVVSAILGARQPFSLLFILLAAFAIASNVAMIIQTVRGGILRLGGYLAHVGLGLLLVGIVASSMYSQEGPPMTLQEGVPQEALGYRFTFLGWQETPGEKPALRLEVVRGESRYIALPQLYKNPQDDSLVATPDVYRFLTHDLYIAAEGYTPGQDQEKVMVAEGDESYAAGYTLTLQALTSTDPYVQAVLTAERAGSRVTITPTFALTDTTVPGQLATLPDGTMVRLSDVYLPAPGLLLLVEGYPISIGSYTVTLRDMFMLSHGAENEGGAAVALEFTGPQGTVVVTPTLVVGPLGVESSPVGLYPGATVRLDQMAVEQRAAQVLVEGLDLPRQSGFVWLQLQNAAGGAGAAQVRASIKPGMNILWAGGLLLLLGTAVAIVRRWWEGK